MINNKLRAFILSAAMLATSLAISSCGQAPQTSEAYQPSWDSLRQHNTPQWFEDAKFGIYFHWNAATVQNLYREDKLERLKAIEKWTGEKFDANEWADLMQAAGAEFGGPIAWHGDGILNWNSDITEWNSVQKGPKVDILGELSQALRQRNMKVLTSFHTSKVWNTIWGPVSKENPTYFSPASNNKDKATDGLGRLTEEVHQAYLARMQEVIDKYSPDVLWFDAGFGGTLVTEKQSRTQEGRLLPSADNNSTGIKTKYQKKLLAYYFNSAKQLGQEVDVTYKSYDLPPGIGMRDIEDGNLDGIQYDPWIADIDMNYHHDYHNHWFYNDKNPNKDANTLIDLLVDLVSKNGRLLLNVPPKADGSFDDDQIKQLTEMGNWLKVNGEAIYATSPWTLYGEGPASITHTGHHAHNKLKLPKYSSQDIRFTSKGNYLYATILDWPNDQAVIKALGSAGRLFPGDIESVELLGYKKTMRWRHTPDALEIDMPNTKVGQYAHVFKITLTK